MTYFQFQQLPCLSTPFQVNSLSFSCSGFNHDGHILTFHGHGCRSSSYSFRHRCFDCDRSWKLYTTHLHYSFHLPICTEHGECLTSASIEWETSLSVMRFVKCLISARRAHHQTDMGDSASHHFVKIKGEFYVFKLWIFHARCPRTSEVFRKGRPSILYQALPHQNSKNSENLHFWIRIRHKPRKAHLHLLRRRNFL